MGTCDREGEFKKLRSRNVASWEVHGKGSLRQGSGEGKGDKVEVGDVHTAGLLWIFDGSVPWVSV